MVIIGSGALIILGAFIVVEGIRNKKGTDCILYCHFEWDERMAIEE